VQGTYNGRTTVMFDEAAMVELSDSVGIAVTAETSVGTFQVR
jgi:hypothetical protein